MNVGRNRRFRRRLVSVPARTVPRDQCRGVATEAGGRAEQRVFPHHFSVRQV
jgi:hypothetical protein